MAAAKKGAAPAPNPEADARARRRIEVEAVLRVLREELPALERANPRLTRLDLLAAIHQRYEQEQDAITASEERIDAAK